MIFVGHLGRAASPTPRTLTTQRHAQHRQFVAAKSRRYVTADYVLIETVSVLFGAGRFVWPKHFMATCSSIHSCGGDTDWSSVTPDQFTLTALLPAVASHASVHLLRRFSLRWSHARPRHQRRSSPATPHFPQANSVFNLVPYRLPRSPGPGARLILRDTSPQTRSVRRTDCFGWADPVRPWARIHRRQIESRTRAAGRGGQGRTIPTSAGLGEVSAVLIAPSPFCRESSHSPRPPSVSPNAVRNARGPSFDVHRLSPSRHVARRGGA